MAGHAGQMDTPRPELDEEGDVERAEPDGLDRKEIGRQDPACLAAQELRPGRTPASRCRTEPMSSKERPDRRGRDPDAELGQLFPDPHASPPGVLCPHPKDEIPHILCDRRPPAGGPVRIGPLPAYQLTVPPKQGLRTDQER
jgi:hypothetical protein